MPSSLAVVTFDPAPPIDYEAVESGLRAEYLKLGRQLPPELDSRVMRASSAALQTL
jgi:hypothetical protein